MGVVVVVLHALFKTHLYFIVKMFQLGTLVALSTPTDYWDIIPKQQYTMQQQEMYFLISFISSKQSRPSEHWWPFPDVSWQYRERTRTSPADTCLPEPDTCHKTQTNVHNKHITTDKICLKEKRYHKKFHFYKIPHNTLIFQCHLL